MTRNQITNEPQIDDEFLNKIRAAYRDYQPQPVPLPFLVQGGRQRRRRLALVLASAAAVTIPTLGVVLVTSQINGPPSSPGEPAASTSPKGSEPPAVKDPQLGARLYALLDAHPEYGFYMLEISDDTKRVTLYRIEQSASIEGEVTAIVEDAGYTMLISEVPPRQTWSETSQQALSTAAEEMRAVLTDAPESAFADLKIEIPLNTIVLWRTTPSETTDRHLQQVADNAGIQLELRTAPMSEAAAQQLGARLAKDNPEWRDLGFTVNGAYATGSGPIVVVRGDVDAARAALADEPHILAVEYDDGTPLIGTR